jgi:Fic family protein
MTPPEGLNHREWWLGLKFSRMSSGKTTEFRACDSAPFRYHLVDPIPEKLHALDLAAGGTLESTSGIINTENRDRYYISSLMEEAITSSQLEGAATTAQVAREMLSNGRPPRNHDEQMIFNNFLTMRMIGECKAEKLTKDRIFEIHRRVTLETLTNPDAAGRFRNADDGDIYVHDKMSLDIYHRPPAPDTLDHRLQLLCDFANGSTAQGFVHPVIRAIIVHFMLAYDHPFVDGNGRTARALFYWTLLHHGYWLFEFITISPILRKSPGRYAKAFLYTETDENDLTYFILHQLDVIDKAMAAFRAYVARKTQQQHAIEQKLRGHVSLNHRQIALLSHAGRHPMHRYTVTSHQTRHGTVYQTARTDLLELEKQGLLVKTKLGKTFYFAAVENLEKALEQLGGAND